METSLQIGLSFVAAILGVIITSLLNLWIHKSSTKHISIENKKAREATEKENEKNRKSEVSLALMKEVKLPNMSLDEILDMLNKAEFQEAVSAITELPGKMQENTEETSKNYNQELDDDIIKTDGENDYVRWN